MYAGSFVRKIRMLSLYYICNTIIKMSFKRYYSGMKKQESRRVLLSCKKRKAQVFLKLWESSTAHVPPTMLIHMMSSLPSFIPCHLKKVRGIMLYVSFKFCVRVSSYGINSILLP